MTSLLVEDFENGAVDTAPSAANTLFTSYAGATTTRAFSNVNGLFGQNVLFTTDGTTAVYAQCIFAPAVTTLFQRWYMNTAHAADSSAGQTIVAGALLGSSYRSQVTYGIGTGILGIRQVSTLKKSTVNEYLNQWIRLEWDQTSPSGTTGTQTLRVYAGANLHTTTPTETLTDITGPGTFDRIRLGFVTTTANANSMRIDGVSLSDSAQPGPLPPPSAGPAPYVWDGTNWVKKNTISVWNGTAWVDKTTITVY